VSHRKSFADYDWKLIADAIGAQLVKLDERTAHMVIQNDRTSGKRREVEVSENGGEVNVCEVVRLPLESVPYWSNAHPGGNVGPYTLASRIAFELEGETPDYLADLDAEGTP
jgi:hypothetical protein